MGIAEGVTNVSILEWWVNNEDIPPNWAVSIQEDSFVPAILCCSRKSFGILKDSFNTDQNLALEDYL